MLDADVIIRAEKGVFDLDVWLDSQTEETFEIAAITVAELWHGVERAAGARRLHREKYLQSVMASLPVINYTEETAYEHARIWAGLSAAGAMIGYHDLIVAATARERGSAVATFNHKHFSAVPGLRVIEPK
ncbi:MAG TPA: PIN domain-containing protein [Verrucomicrobiae bacterium]|nr:PIN domain-containing protein [Verrucomicrobiae bacterium]